MGLKERISDHVGDIAEGAAELIIEGVGHLSPGGRFKVQDALPIAGEHYAYSFTVKRVSEDQYQRFEANKKQLDESEVV